MSKWEDTINTVVCGDNRVVMASFPDAVFQTCITSPPYWGLRDYGVEPVVWDGDPDCQHAWGDKLELHDVREETQHGKTRTTDRFYGDESRRFDGNHQKHISGSFCSSCGAWLGSLGLEPTPELYISHLVQIFREVRRTLRDDGTLWVNIGDSYAGGKTGSQGNCSTLEGGKTTQQVAMNRPNKSGGNLKPKDLVMIPFRLALALQADGWWVRSDICWWKENCMPDSTTDRPTKAHEYVFLCTKSGKAIYWTHRSKNYKDGVYKCPKTDYRWLNKQTGEELAQPPEGDWKKLMFTPKVIVTELRKDGVGVIEHEEDGKPERTWRRINLWKGNHYYYDHKAIKEPYTEPLNRWGGDSKKVTDNLQEGSPYEAAHRKREMRPDDDGRNKRSVWAVPTVPYPGAHFAVMPEKLVEPMILAGSKQGDVVFDPFSGAGTVPKVAVDLGRQYVGCDIKQEYCDMAVNRVKLANPDLPMF